MKTPLHSYLAACLPEYSTFQCACFWNVLRAYATRCVYQPVFYLLSVSCGISSFLLHSCTFNEAFRIPGDFRHHIPASPLRASVAVQSLRRTTPLHSKLSIILQSRLYCTSTTNNMNDSFWSVNNSQVQNKQTCAADFKCHLQCPSEMILNNSITE